MWFVTWFVAWGASSAAWGAPGEVAEAPDEAPPEVSVIVPSHPFARWDRTRWRVDAQVILPFPSPVYAATNFEVQAVAYDIRLVTRCELGENVGPRRKEVDCAIESAALSLAPWQRELKTAGKVLADNKERLEALTVRLQVTDDGRVTNLTLVNEQQWNRRTQVQYENLRQILWGAFAGFDLRLPKGGIRVGRQFVDKTSRLWWMPSFRTYASQALTSPAPSPVGNNIGMAMDAPREAPSDFGGSRGAGVPTFDNQQQLIGTPLVNQRPGAANRTGFESLIAPSAMGRGDIVHQVNLHEGQYLIQSVGEGSVDLGLDQPLVWRGNLSGIGIISAYDAILTERIWTMEMLPTASNVLSEGVEGWPYRAQGKLRKLSDDEVSETGASAIVSPPGDQPRGALPPWPPLL